MPKNTTPARTVLYIPNPLLDALRKEAAGLGRDPNDHILRILGDHAASQGLLSEEDAVDHRLRSSLIDRAAEEARRICREGGFDEDITLNTFDACMQDLGFVTDYEAYIQGNAYAHGNPRKSINMDIGHSIKTAIGAEVLRNASGSPVKVPVQGKVIQSYTKMASFDPAVVG